MNAAQIESAKITGRIANAHQDAADQKTGQYKEKIHTAPTHPKCGTEPVQNTSEITASTIADVVEKKYEKNSDSAKVIEFRDATLRNSIGHVSAARKLTARAKPVKPRN